jgi:hypothetical protein
MSGTNRLINSINTVKGNNLEALKGKLVNSNTVAKSTKEIPLKNKTSAPKVKKFN